MKISLKGLTRSYNTRTEYSKKSVAQLADNMKQVGQIHDIVVVKTATGYDVVAGWRRVLAANMLGWTEISATEISADETKLLSISVSENVHRKSMPPMDIADAVERLSSLGGLNQTECAKRLGVSVALISECVNAKTNLSEGVRDMLKGQGLSAHTLISKLPTELQLDVANDFVTEKWTRAQLKKRVDELTKKPKEKDQRITVTIKSLPTYDALFSRLTQAINTLKTLKKLPDGTVDYAAILSKESNE